MTNSRHTLLCFAPLVFALASTSLAGVSERIGVSRTGEEANLCSYPGYSPGGSLVSPVALACAVLRHGEHICARTDGGMIVDLWLGALLGIA